MDSSSDNQSSSDTSKPLIALEEKLSFQQRQLDELNAVILDQQAELERQRRELVQLADVMRGLVNRVGKDLPHEKPPHY